MVPVSCLNHPITLSGSLQQLKIDASIDAEAVAAGSAHFSSGRQLASRRAGDASDAAASSSTSIFSVTLRVDPATATVRAPNVADGSPGSSSRIRLNAAPSLRRDIVIGLDKIHPLTTIRSSASKPTSSDEQSASRATKRKHNQCSVCWDTGLSTCALPQGTTPGLQRRGWMGKAGDAATPTRPSHSSFSCPASFNRTAARAAAKEGEATQIAAVCGCAKEAKSLAWNSRTIWSRATTSVVAAGQEVFQIAVAAMDDPTTSVDQLISAAATLTPPALIAAFLVLIMVSTVIGSIAVMTLRLARLWLAAAARRWAAAASTGGSPTAEVTAAEAKLEAAAERHAEILAGYTTPPPSGSYFFGSERSVSIWSSPRQAPQPASAPAAASSSSLTISVPASLAASAAGTGLLPAPRHPPNTNANNISLLSIIKRVTTSPWAGKGSGPAGHRWIDDAAPAAGEDDGGREQQDDTLPLQPRYNAASSSFYFTDVSRTRGGTPYSASSATSSSNHSSSHSCSSVHGHPAGAGAATASSHVHSSADSAAAVAPMELTYRLFNPADIDSSTSRVAHSRKESVIDSAVGTDNLARALLVSLFAAKPSDSSSSRSHSTSGVHAASSSSSAATITRPSARRPSVCVALRAT